MGVRPGGSSSMTETSRSPYRVSESVRGMGVAVMHQDVRGVPVDQGFVHQAFALQDAEAVLFVDDDEAEFGERDVVFDQRVGADGELRLAGGDALKHGAFFREHFRPLTRSSTR